jgi:hypothetical protein
VLQVQLQAQRGQQGLSEQLVLQGLQEQQEQQDHQVQQGLQVQQAQQVRQVQLESQVLLAFKVIAQDSCTHFLHQQVQATLAVVCLNLTIQHWHLLHRLFSLQQLPIL